MYDQELVECSSTDILKPNEEIIGQERAQKALRFGLEIHEKGFNVYVAGMPGTGRKTAVRNYLYELASTKPKGDDWVYVNNFSNPYEPIAIRVPPGMGIQLKADMAAFIEEARRALPRAFESEDYEAKRQDALRKLATERGEIIDRANEARQASLSIQVGPTGLMIIPVIETSLSPEAFEALPKETKESIMKKRESLDADLRAEFRRIREIDVRGMEIVGRLNSEIALFAIGHLITDLEERYGNNREVFSYIENVQKDILNNLGAFLGVVPQPQDQVPAQFQQFLAKDLAFRKYEVNIIVDNGANVGAPVIFEETPSYQNLLGRRRRWINSGCHDRFHDDPPWFAP